MTREAGLCCGPSVVIASRWAPGCHDASCTLVVKLSSATRLSLLAGQPKPTRAVLLTQVLPPSAELISTFTHAMESALLSF